MSDVKSDFGPAERALHDYVVLEETVQAGIKRARVDAALLLDRYRKRNLIEERQYEAGIRLRSTWIDAGRLPHVTCQYNELIASGSVAGFYVGREDARKAYIAAMRAVGPIASNEIVSACLLDLPMGGAVRLEILRRGLTVLADHYRMGK